MFSLIFVVVVVVVVVVVYNSLLRLGWYKTDLIT